MEHLLLSGDDPFVVPAVVPQLVADNGVAASTAAIANPDRFAAKRKSTVSAAS
jgi:hypothetical protein